MHIRQLRLENQLQDIKIQSNMQVTECQYQGGLRKDLWVVWIYGRKNSLWQGGIYPITIQFPENYPTRAPIISFPNDFQHVHVYQGGLICMPILEGQNWKPKTSMLDLLYRIDGLIHQQINKYSPANDKLYQIYKIDPNKYQNQVKQQAIKFMKKDIIYFKKPCIHIDMYPK